MRSPRSLPSFSILSFFCRHLSTAIKEEEKEISYISSFFVRHSSIAMEEEEKEIYSSSFFFVGKEQEKALLLFR